MFQLPEDDRKLLLDVARVAVRSHLWGMSLRLPEIDDCALMERHGLFVSIHQGRELRGCIGNVMPELPLYRATAQCAVAAASADPRFPPVTEEELARLSFELSVLAIPERVHNVEEIEVGKHGLIVSKGSVRGLLLPQVATQYRWNCNQFLAETCIKAGLHPEAWREGASIHCFTADVFGDANIHQPATL